MIGCFFFKIEAVEIFDTLANLFGSVKGGLVVNFCGAGALSGICGVFFKCFWRGNVFYFCLTPSLCFSCRVCGFKIANSDFIL